MRRGCSSVKGRSRLLVRGSSLTLEMDQVYAERLAETVGKVRPFNEVKDVVIERFLFQGSPSSPINISSGSFRHCYSPPSPFSSPLSSRPRTPSSRNSVESYYDR